MPDSLSEQLLKAVESKNSRGVTTEEYELSKHRF